MTYQAQDDTQLDGPLTALYEGRPGSGRRLISRGLIEDLADRMRPFISERQRASENELRHDLEYRYPIDAVREAVLNGLVHRDWPRSIEVEVVNYADRLEVLSPGTLQNTMTIEKMLAGQRSPRNPIIAEIMRDYGYVDMRGMGVRRKIVPLSRSYTGRDAKFELSDDHLRVILPARESGKRTAEPEDPRDDE